MGMDNSVGIAGGSGGMHGAGQKGGNWDSYNNIKNKIFLHKAEAARIESR